MRSHLVRVVALVVVVAPAWIGATSGSASAAGCKVLKKPEVQRAIDRKVKVGPAPTGIGGACSFTVRGAPLDVVNVWVLEGDDAEQGFETGRSVAGESADEVSGVGDEAVYTGEPFNTLYALKGDKLVYLQYYLLSGDDAPAKVQRAVTVLTKKVLERI